MELGFKFMFWSISLDSLSLGFLSAYGQSSLYVWSWPLDFCSLRLEVDIFPLLSYIGKFFSFLLFLWIQFAEYNLPLFNAFEVRATPAASCWLLWSGFDVCL